MVSMSSKQKHYILITCHKYIQRIVEHHGWTQEKAHTLPIPMRNEPSYMAELENTTGPTDPTQQNALENEMGFSYRQVIGEAVLAMTLCRVDIAPAIIKLSQYSANPAKCHYKAAKALLVYLWYTQHEGIYYWRTTPNDTLEDCPLPKTVTKAIQLQPYHQPTSPTDLHGSADATWASDRQHRKSTGGIVFFFVGHPGGSQKWHHTQSLW